MLSNFKGSNKTLIEEALSCGINLVDTIGEKVALLEHDGHFEYIHSRTSSKTGAFAHIVCKNKELSSEILSRAGISLPKYASFHSGDFKDGVKFAKSFQWKVVIKPSDSSGGEGITTLIENEDDFEAGWKIAGPGKIIIEEKFFGCEYRIFTTRDRFIAATLRDPANIIGDGVNTIQGLIDKKNADQGRSREGEIDKPLYFIKVDETALNFLKKNNLSTESVPDKDQKVYLRENSNLLTGGDSIDVTDEVHSSVKEICLKAIKSIPALPYAGIDFMTKDISAVQTQDSYRILEINSNPGIEMHHRPMVGTSRNVAREIVGVIFPEVKNEK
ncbi:MAG: hypothetical protein WC107_01545 [Patescibacteria group bacterium]